jgi:hypothetical protein
VFFKDKKVRKDFAVEGVVHKQANGPKNIFNLERRKI